MRDEAKGKYQVKDLPLREVNYSDYMWDKELTHTPIHALDTDITKAMQKLRNWNPLYEEMPGLDCGLRRAELQSSGGGYRKGRSENHGLCLQTAGESSKSGK